MKIIKLRFFFIIIFFLSYLKKCLLLNQEKNINLRKLSVTSNSSSSSGSSSSSSSSGSSSSSSSSGSSSSSSSSGSSSSSSSSGSSSGNPHNSQNEDEDEVKYEECQGMVAYEPTDCFEIELDFKKNIKKCCFFVYKDKKYSNKRKRMCTILTNEEFLDIKKTIKSIETNNKNFTVLSLECDKSNIFSLNIILLILSLFSL